MTAEQKAEEIANKRCHEIMCYGHCSFNSPKHHRCGEWHREYNCALDGYHEGFKDCAKARLNVTTISDCPIKDEWHYVEYEDLPMEEKEYLVYSEEWGYEIRKFLVDVGYFECRKNDEIIKWKEIEK